LEPPPVEVTGEVDAMTSIDLRDRLGHVIDAHPGATIVVDLSGLEFIDSTGLGVLVGALKRSRLAQGDVVLRAVPASTWRVLVMTGLDTVFTTIGSP